ncbi:tyramine receptor 1-like [Bombus vosnesenskii]|uniref:Tyramine receptor 1-like n=4 Tax=Bombus TaxID=28641 RepID=A0A6J3KVY9_9HYME|nr:tyramine receptor 1 [Bombus terrestris]XP_003393337.1 tyramine receptor 1 [Bombus terrestris]XP_003492508.1 tyramine receptor 1 [Bombus impatiens]XP_012245652.1 tyramine receptor 1 [Bombus impatiens]XP_033178858.1 tyramine receptor 1 [Bombus impatiens]XP_033178859.1 tyramine receptor 1 [Bombus impatiens]XP_033194477.1 tyramine receptor 1-like [Bombus vancouverensis nearcticus]XP_033194478.1 tyramine receptor 1-like [Bombus vancouverensis nearcticus]XP_033194479.1 tyramine receptor 1-like
MANQTANYYGDVYQWNHTVSTVDRDTQSEYYLPNWTDLVLAGLFIMLIIVTIVGNTLVIAAVITTRRLRSVTNCFVSSLAAADLLVGLAVMPPAVLLQLTGGTWQLGEVLCDSWVSLDILLCTASILSLCAISIDRYLAVTQPLIYSRRRRSKRLAGLMIVAVWVLAGAITSPPLLGCFPRATNRDTKKCSYNMDSSYVIFSAMGSFFLPMLVMLYVYGRISCVIASRHRNLEATESENIRPRRNVLIERAKSIRVRRTECVTSSVTCDRASDEAEPPSTSKRSGIVRSHQQSCINRVARETKTAATLAVVVGGFVACWLPFFILYLATPFVPMEPPDILMPALTWLGWINSAINPFIYAFYSADFRLAFWRLTCRKCFKTRTNLDRSNRKLPAPTNWKKDNMEDVKIGE